MKRPSLRDRIAQTGELLARVAAIPEPPGDDERDRQMNEYHWNGVDYEVEVTPHKLDGVKNRHGQDVFWYITRVRQKGQDAWTDIWDVDSPYYNPTADSARRTGEWYIRNHNV